MFVNVRRRSAGPSPPLPRRPTMLLLLLYQLLPTAASESTTSAPVTFVKPLDTCPDVGYFFERELTNGVEPGPCYLCFCKGTDHAVCSLRENERCDDHYYKHLKREARLRRSPGFSRAASKEKKQLSKAGEECKPLKSSKSIGCPPADWCVGCKVCDCSIDGHWNCHVMSFCPTQKSSKVTAKRSRKSPPKEPNNSRQIQNLPKTVALASVPKKTYPQKKFEKKLNASDDQTLKKKVKKSISYAQPMISVETKRQFQKITTKDVPIIIKRYISTNSPIKSPELLKYKNDTKKFAQMLYKHYKSNINNPPYETKKWSSKAMGDKLVNKRSLMKKNIKVSSLNAMKPMNIKDHKDKSKTMNRKNKSNKNHDMIKKKKLNYNAKKYKGKKYDSGKRSKREIPLTTTKTTKKEIEVEIIDTAANTVVPKDKYEEATEISFTYGEDMALNLSNYAYTVDNNATLSIPTVKSINTNTVYATTEHNVIVVTMDYTNFTRTGSKTLESLLNERQNGKKGNNTVKRNTIEANFETTTVANNTVNFSQSTKVKTVDLNFIMDDKPHKNEKEAEKNFTNDKKIVHGQDVRKMFTRRKKISLTKLVKTLNARSKKYYQNNTSKDSKSTSFRINGTLNDIQAVLEKLVHGYMRNHTQNSLKKKSNMAVKYLKKLFSKLFSGNNNKTDDKIAVMDSICENFGPCKISVKKLGVLNYKVNQLISETHKALSSIKIIKGLLQLVEDRNEKNGNATQKEPDLKEHVKKLTAILKDSYAPEDQLTQTQATQMYYIKSNTQVFIKSIGKFANILNEIINLIKSENSKTKRTIHDYKVIKSTYPIVQERGVVSKLKNLLLRYNLLQNTFLRQMYEALTTLEVQNRNAKMHNYKKYSRSTDKVYKMEIERYVDNININLRKLRDLAAKVGTKERRKREAMGDDEAIEYLLTVMEFLLKRNNSLEAPPDNDGIDLLIEAIKSAPDIKPIKKKVLQYVPVKITGPTSSAESREENVSNPKIVKKPVTEIIVTTKKDEFEMEEDPYKKPAELTTERDVVIADLSDVITEYPSKVYMATYDNYENTEKPFFEKAISDVKDIGEPIKGIKKEDGTKDDESDTIVLDEENNRVTTKTPSDIFAEVQTDPPVVEVSTHKANKKEKGKMRHYRPTNSQHPKKSSKKAKTKLDLINDAYEEEIKENKALTTRRPDPVKSSRAKGETGNRDKKKLAADSSSITKETDEIQEKEGSEDLIYKKQMDLLNSLDYGTEKSVAEESDSKDVSSPLDRLNNDAFPNYFV